MKLHKYNPNKSTNFFPPTRKPHFRIIEFNRKYKLCPPTLTGSLHSTWFLILMLFIGFLTNVVNTVSHFLLKQCKTKLKYDMGFVRQPP